MGRRARNSGLLSMMDAPELRGLAAYMQGRRWRRDPEGHPEGGPDEPDDTDEETDDEEEEDESEGDEDKPKDDKPDDEVDDDDKPHHSKREYEKLQRRLKASDARQGKLQKQLDDLKAGKAGELDKAVRAEIDELKPKVNTLTEANKGLRLQVAFLTTTVKNVVWEDPDAAMRLIDLSDVDIDPDTGAIDRRDLAAAMRKLAKDKPYLVKKAKPADDDDDEEEPEDKSSAAPMNRRRGRRKAPDRKELSKRFPVLGRM